jgi:glycosyltransferase involved in cell wall biosynthesis
VKIEPEISVLMPVRDAGRWLVEAVESIRAQTTTSWELLAVDDGSRDETAGLLAELAHGDARIRMLATSEGRRGIVAALNLALAEARGRFVARMDADDVAEPFRFERQLARLDAEPGLDAVSCRVEGFPTRALGEGMRRYLDWQNSLVEPDELRRDRFVEASIIAPTLMIRAGTLRETLGGWLDNDGPEDWDLILRLHEAGGRIARVPETLHHWRQHADQATRTDSRYDADHLLATRARYLARYLTREAARHRRSIWLLGAGPVGKALAESLTGEGAEIEGFAEIDPRKIGNIVQRAGRKWPVISMDELLAAGPTSCYAVAAVGRAGARERIRSFMSAAGWVEERDFIAAA